MDKSALEKHIANCERFIRDAEAKFAVSGSRADKASAEGWRIARARAIDARGPVAVEAERGVA